MQLNHVMVYTTDLKRALAFYADALGLQVLVATPLYGYARLKFPDGAGTLALHLAEPGATVAADGIRLYFEVRDLDAFCDRLVARGVAVKQMPQDMPWGWRHAYVDDPDGHEISLYWAGSKRLEAEQG
jgi:catechol 2,3-dioxygenase-like lactoylglutathione lyase family enzyme